MHVDHKQISKGIWMIEGNKGVCVCVCVHACMCMCACLAGIQEFLCHIFSSPAIHSVLLSPWWTAALRILQHIEKETNVYFVWRNMVAES